MPNVRHHLRGLLHRGGSPGRSSPEVLVGTTRRNNGTGNAILIAKDDRSRKLLTELKAINGKECSFRPLGNQTRKAYIMMGVPSCVSELLQQDKDVLEASRMTKWNSDKQKSEPTNMVNVVLVGKQHPIRFTRGYGSFRMRPFVREPLQCYNCQKFCRYCAGRHPSNQCKDNKTLKCVNCEQGHATISQLCPKKLEAENKAPKIPTTKQVNINPAPIPLENACATLTVQEVEKQPFSEQPSTPQTTTIEEPMKVGIKPPKQTARNSIPKTIQNRKSEPVKVVSAPQQTTNAWTKLRTINDGVSGRYVSEPDKTVHFKTIGQSMPTSQQATNKTRKNKWTMYRKQYTLHSPVLHL